MAILLTALLSPSGADRIAPPRSKLPVVHVAEFQAGLWRPAFAEIPGVLNRFADVPQLLVCQRGDGTGESVDDGRPDQDGRLGDLRMVVGAARFLPRRIPPPSLRLAASFRNRSSIVRLL